MFQNAAVQKNIAQLKEMDIAVMGPSEGELACHDEGPGRLPEPEKIFEQAWTLLSRQDLSGLSILITAGPTVEPIDPVRYITNRSTGKMGYALARAAWRRGASVRLVSGPTTVNPPCGVSLFRVKTAEEMRQVVYHYQGALGADRRDAARALVQLAPHDQSSTSFHGSSVSRGRPARARAG